MRSLLALLFILAGADYTHANNVLSNFVFPVVHPICGLNPDFDNTNQSNNIAPFNKCLTLAMGAGVDKTYADPEILLVANLIMLVMSNGGWEKSFESTNQISLGCRMKKNADPTLTPLPGTEDIPFCTKELISEKLATYNQIPQVIDVKKFDMSLQAIDINDENHLLRLKQAVAVAQASDGALELSEVIDLLQ